MKNIFFKGWIFFKTGLTYSLSYKFNFAMQGVQAFSQVLLFYFLSKLVGPDANPHLALYNNDYFAFVLIGIAYSGYLAVFLTAFASGIREEQILGTLESLALVPEPFILVTLLNAIWALFETTLRVGLYLLFGFLLFDLTFPGFSLFPALLVLGLGLVAFLPLGLLGAAFTLYFKEGNPIGFVAGFFKFFSGVYFPVTLFPDWLEKLSYSLPATPALIALRKILLGGEPLSNVTNEVTGLVLFTLVATPISLWAFQIAYRKAKQSGSLSHY